MKIKNLKKVVIANHFYAVGPAENLLDFCIVNKIAKAMYVGHPLLAKEDKRSSYWQLYIHGVLKKGFRKKSKRGKDAINFINNAFITIWWILRSKEKWDLYIGSNNLNAFCGVLLKWMGKVKRTVYFAIDYVPKKRFENKTLDRLYHWVDIFCVKTCDITWNLSPRMTKGREKYAGLNMKYRVKQVVVPEGVWLKRIQKLSLEKINQHHLVFLGHLAPRLGVQKVIEAVPRIVKKIPDFKFIIIGKGEYRKKLEQLAHSLGVAGFVNFKGFIPDHREVERIISRCAIGIAAYSNEQENFSYYADPSKTKIYMGCGLPVIMTDIFYNAKEIEKSGAGKVVKYDADEIAKIIIEMMESPMELKRYKENAGKYIKDLDWNLIFEKNLRKIIVSEYNFKRYGQYKNDIFNKIGIDFEKGKKLLDVGCGDGADGEIFINELNLDVCGIDIFEDKNIKNINGFKFKKAGVYNIPFKDNTFDYVFLHNVLHHIDEKKQNYKNHTKALKELKRVCKKNGRIIIIEANRYNPIFYLHMVLIKGHNHFTQTYFKKTLKDVFGKDVCFRSFEAHSYPSALFERFDWAFRTFELICEKIPFFRRFRAYNLAVYEK